MKIAGIICECDPPHAGHAYLLHRAAQESDAVVCLLSGAFCQRAAPAVLDKHARAQMLLSMGADLVLEHPFPSAAAGAEAFARSGVAALSGIGVTSLWFGSECGDLDLLRGAAEKTASASFQTAYADACKNSRRGTADLYFDLLRTVCGASAPVGPNDTLAIAYLKAISSLQADVTARTVKRLGSGFSDADLPENGFPSATALRQLLLSGAADRVYPCLPNDACRDILRRELDRGMAPISFAKADSALLGLLRLCDPEKFRSCAGLDGGLGERILKSAAEATSFADLLSRVATKKYPDARIRRGILFGLLGVTAADLVSSPAYLGLLASGPVGRKILSRVRKTDGISAVPVVSSRSAIPRTPAAARVWEMENRAAALISLCYPSSVSAADLLRRWFVNPSKPVDKSPQM